MKLIENIAISIRQINHFGIPPAQSEDHYL